MSFFSRNQNTLIWVVCVKFYEAGVCLLPFYNLRQKFPILKSCWNNIRAFKCLTVSLKSVNYFIAVSVNSRPAPALTHSVNLFNTDNFALSLLFEFFVVFGSEYISYVSV